jgi:hypothetical protein
MALNIILIHLIKRILPKQPTKVPFTFIHLSFNLIKISLVHSTKLILI